MRRLLAAAALWVLAGELCQAAGTVTCSVSATGLAFGIYDPLSASPTLSTALVTMTCTLVSGGASFVTPVSSYSTGSSGTNALRTMLFGTTALNYNFYLDAGMTQPAGDGSNGSVTGGGTTLHLIPPVFSGQVQDTLYGRIPAGQAVTDGAYLDTIIVTVNY
jgi:spore coat protein U-like protein